MPKLNRPKDAKNLVEKEITHTPQVEVSGNGDGYRVTITVGKIKHGMEPNHFIEYIELYDDETFVARADIGPSTLPVASFWLKAMPEKPVAHARCTTHGEWSNA